MRSKESLNDSIKFQYLPSRSPIMSPINFPTGKIGLKKNNVNIVVSKKFAQFSDHVYLRHLSTEYRSILSADMSTDSRPICPPSIGRYVGRHVGRVSVDMLFELIDCRSTLSVGMSVDTRPTSRPICRWCIGRLSVVYRSTVVAIGVLLTVVLLK